MRLFALAGFAVAAATTAQAMPRAPLDQANGLITQVRDGCGAGKVMADGQCVLRHDIRVQRRVDRRNNYATSGTGYTGNNQGTYGAGNCYRSWDQDARNFKYMPCPTGAPGPYGTAYGAHYVDTPGVHAIMNARERLGRGTWYPYATSSGITCTPGTTIKMGGQDYLCQ